MCRESQDGVTVYSEDAAGDWTRTDVMLPPLERRVPPGRRHDLRLGAAIRPGPSTSLSRGATVLGARRGRTRMGVHPDDAERRRRRLQRTRPRDRARRATRSSSVSTQRENHSQPRRMRGSESGRTRGCSNTTQRTPPARRATNSPASPSIRPWRSATGRTSSRSRSTRPSSSSLRSRPSSSISATWRRRIGARCGSAASRAGTSGGSTSADRRFPVRSPSIAPAGDAVVIDGRIYKVGVCASDHGFEPTDVTGVVAVGPGATRWISRDGDALQLQRPQRSPVDRTDRRQERRAAGRLQPERRPVPRAGRRRVSATG